MTARLFFDTNVLLDHLLDRPPHADPATELWSRAERRELVGLVSAISFNFVYYIVRHHSDDRTARRAIRGMRDVFEIVEADAQIIHQAIDAKFADFEDAIQHACALRAAATMILTRDARGFRRSELPVIGPVSYLQLEESDE